MSYAISGALQRAVYQHLIADIGLSALIGGAVYDAVPTGPVAGTYVVLGEEDARDRSSQTGGGAEHRVLISVVSDAEGFETAKAVAGTVSDALDDADLTLDRGHLVCLQFSRARARRVRSGQTRRIDLTFRAIVEDD